MPGAVRKPHLPGLRKKSVLRLKYLIFTKPRQQEDRDQEVVPTARGETYTFHQQSLT